MFRGTISGDATSPKDNLPYKVISFYLINKSGSTNTVNVSVLGGSSEYFITPYNMVLAAAGSPDSWYITDVPFFMKNDEQIKVVSSGDLSYYFNQQNIDP